GIHPGLVAGLDGVQRVDVAVLDAAVAPLPAPSAVLARPEAVLMGAREDRARARLDRDRVDVLALEHAAGFLPARPGAGERDDAIRGCHEDLVRSARGLVVVRTVRRNADRH